MYITINVGWSQTINAIASHNIETTCSVSFKLDQQMLETDVEGILPYVTNALLVCRKAVEGELASRPRGGPDDDAGNFASDPLATEPSAANGKQNPGRGSPGYGSGFGYRGALSTWQ
jgi:hypothetical protein